MQDLSSDRLIERASNAATVAASPNPFAYLFYATNDAYAVAALVVIAFLNITRTVEGLHTLLEGCDPDYDGAVSMHLWSHL